MAGDGGFVAALDGKVEIAEDPLALVVGEGELIEAEDFGAAGGGWGEADAAADDKVFGEGDVVELFEHFDAALDLGGFGGFGAEAFDEALDLFFLLVEVLFLGGELLDAADAGFGVVVVRAVVHGGPSGIDFEGFGGEGVEEVAVVGDEEKGAGEGAEVALEPFDGREVEVVGGFVEEEGVGGGDEDAGEFGAHLPSAAELVEGFGEVGGGEAEAAEGGLGIGPDAVAAELFEAGLEASEFVEEAVAGGGVGEGELVFDVMDAGFDVAEFGDGVGDVVGEG